jgi:uncharacterized membrane protein YqjE
MSGDNTRSDAPETGAPASGRRGRSGQMAARLTSLAGSVMDLHVRIALQEADREKRRLISGVLLLAGGLVSLLLALVAAELALLLLAHFQWRWSWIEAALALAALNLILSGLFLRLGGRMTRGPYLPETMAGLTKTTRALLGR